MPGRAYQSVYDLAEDQLGYFTATQAHAAGVAAAALSDMHRRGLAERTSRGVYRLVHFPRSALAPYMEASLWPQVKGEAVRGVIGFESALAFYELSDVSPHRMHIVVPTKTRIRRAVPSVLVVHRADLPEADIAWRDGIPVTTPVRAIRDCHAAHLGPALIRQAIADGRRNGELTVREAAQLDRDLFPRRPPSQSSPTRSRRRRARR